MSRVGDIITAVRDTISDADGDRYPDARLWRAITKCQKKITRDALNVKGKCLIEFCNLHHTYKLDISTILINCTPIAIHAIRNHEGDLVKFKTHAWMDKNVADWTTEKGNDIKYIVYDKFDPLKFRLYPIPDKDELSETGASFNEVNNPITQATTITSTITTESNFDITSELAPIKMLVHFYYTPPDIVSSIDDNFLIPAHFDEAVQHYVAGIVLRDDKDTQNREFGKEELAIFESEYAIAKGLSNDDFIDDSDDYYIEVGYNAEIV